MVKVDGVEFSPEDVSTVAGLLAPFGFPADSDEAIAGKSGLRPEVIAQIRSGWVLNQTPAPKKRIEDVQPAVTTVDDLDRAYIIRRARIGDSVEALAARLELSVETVQGVLSSA